MNEISHLPETAVKLRDHPLMRHRGTSNWPPVWMQRTIIGVRKVSGEVGVLIYLYAAPESHKCYLVIEYGKQNYTSTLLFDDARFCRQVANLLRQHIGSSIKDIGDLDVSLGRNNT
jgi:hypothetical protein